jgi:hypothetical protein
VLRFYVLTSRKFGCLKRHFRSLPKEHTTVVINTTDKEYEQKAFQWCYDNKITAVITESNGNAGKGKNSVIDHFLESEYDHMVQIDGDDFLQPHGVNVYNWVSENNPPDGIQLVYGNWWSSLPSDQTHKMYGSKPWYPEFLEWVEDNTDPAKREHFYKMYESRELYRKEFLRHQNFCMRWNYPIDSIAPGDCARLIFYSRKLASLVRFDEELLIGEDSLLNYEVRDMAYKKQIVLKKIKDSRERTYSYDLDHSGIVKASELEGQYDWIKELNDAVEETSKNWTVPMHFVLEEIKHNIEKVPYIEDLGVKE